MNIIHICLAAVYIEGYGYQENILPQMHAAMGHCVAVLTNDRVFNRHNKHEIRDKIDYVNSYGIHVITLKKKERPGYYSKFGGYVEVYKKLNNLKPDVIFVHGGQFVSLMDVIKYCKKNPNVDLYIDQHGDYYNMPINRWQNFLVQRFIYGFWMRRAIPYTTKFWGVTPWRCQYLNEVYKIPKEKIDLLVMGGDDRYIHFERMPEIRTKVRSDLNLEDNDFVLITGGKIDKAKNIHILMKAVADINRKHLKLIVFGQPSYDMEAEIAKLSCNEHIRNLGWVESVAVYNYFLASDLAVFPGTHSVLWEQACACGLPGIFKDWEGMHHVNVGGNACFIKGSNLDEMKNILCEIMDSKEKYNKMKEVALHKAVKVFSYKAIAKKAIGEEGHSDE